MGGYKVFSCGSNGKCQLGNGSDKDSTVLEPVCFDGIDNLTTQPVSIKCGGNHTLILVATGDVFASGDNSAGQCGLQDVDTVCVFSKLPRINNAKWTHISAGWEFSVLVNEKFQAYAVGTGLSGELGLGEGVTRASELRRLDIDLGSGVRSIKSSIHHTVVHLKDGTVLGWGNNKKGQLGVGPRLVWQPAKLEVGKILGYNLCRDFSSFEISGGERRFEIKGTKDAAALTEEANEMLDRLVDEGYDSFTVHNMWTSLHLFGSNGDSATIKSMGNNSHAQRLDGIPQHLQEDVLVCSMGSEHGLLLTDRNKVYAWGWGEHGNCGEGEGTVFASPNEIYDGSSGRVVLIQGGCATSWVVVHQV